MCQRPRMLLLLLLLFFTIIVSYPRPHMPPLSCHLSGDCIAFGGRCVFTLAALTEASLPPTPSTPTPSHPLPLLLFFTQCPHPQYVGLLQKLHLPDSVSSIHTGVVAHGPQACTVYNLCLCINNLACWNGTRMCWCALTQSCSVELSGHSSVYSADLLWVSFFFNLVWAYSSNKPHCSILGFGPIGTPRCRRVHFTKVSNRSSSMKNICMM